MVKLDIPIYDIANLKTAGLVQKDLLIERFGCYLERESPNLSRPHRHAFYHLVYFSRGGGTHSIDFTGYTVQAGQVYFMIPGQVHGWRFGGEVDGYIVNFSEGFFRSFLQDPAYFERFAFLSGIGAEGVRQLNGELREKVEKLLEEMNDWYERNGVAAYDLIKVLLLQLFLLIGEEDIAGGDVGGEAGEGSEEGRSRRGGRILINNMRRLVNQHYRLLRLPKNYAELLYVTPNHLNALCQELLGKSAGALIRERVLLEAKRLLTNADMTVTGIAYELNFQDNSYFNRFFRKYEGLTPEEFRRRYILPG